MSSLAAVQADGYYYPPNWDPSKGNKDQFHHHHPLGRRARKLGQGIVIVRFEMPVNVWCDGCGEHIARGVRYNAEKKQCGMYFSSEIFEFQMNCHLCGQRFIIKTDPQNRDYEFVSGLHRKVESFDTKETGTMTYDTHEQALMRADAIRSLENKEEDNLRSEKLAPTLDRLKSMQETIHANEDVLNRRVRDKLRKVRNAEKRREELAAKEGLQIKLLPTSRSDIRSSRTVMFHHKSKADVNAKLREIEAKSGDIFGKKDAVRERTLKQCIANHVDLSLFKKEEAKKPSLPKLTLKAKKDVKEKTEIKNTLGLVPYDK